MERTPAYGYWFKKRGRLWNIVFDPVATNRPGFGVQKETRGRFHLLGDPRNYSCTLDIRDARRGDTGTYFFRVERGDYLKVTYRNYQLSVIVTGKGRGQGRHMGGALRAAGKAGRDPCSASWEGLRSGENGLWTGWERGRPATGCTGDTQVPRPVSCPPALTHRPDVRLPGILRAGQPTSITCAAPWACGRATPPTFSWTGVGLSATGSGSSGVTLRPGPQHHSTRLTCRVTLPGASVSTETTVLLSVACECGASSPGPTGPGRGRDGSASGSAEPCWEQGPGPAVSSPSNVPGERPPEGQQFCLSVQMRPRT
ncbi:Sialic acid-binding Ig-like lectin 14 [Galemys pyrenaicus]|uniref:Sialic acid-binding Ig-like lectin 14 n=1 Tax=Galemys pyrenaicus TaxID=202257 RepID=A0A8J6DK34_GALPY|nr:Sialic acid-binding Ig-like lectin 14 [Galemys pyrenaicus]